MAGSEKEEGKRFFFEKKKQKTFVNLGWCGETSTAPVYRSFLRRFFTKKRLLT
jgi:hypothetical protein